MSHNEIKDGAIFIADAHYNEERREFCDFLRLVENEAIQTSQLFLMGDMFDLLVGEILYVQNSNKECIELINKISKKKEVIYFEGNHDFNLKNIFPHIKIYPITFQPVHYNYLDKKFALSHGDIYANFSYKLYTKIIRSKFILKILNTIDGLTNNSISKKILNSQKNKNLCRKIPEFKKAIKEKIQFYDIQAKKLDFVCEGHYHQDKEFDFVNVIYKNFSSFACDNCFFKIKFNDTVTFQKESLRG